MKRRPSQVRAARVSLIATAAEVGQMGLWDWLVDSLTGRESSAAPADEPARGARHRESAVATLEPPAGDSTPGQAGADDADTQAPETAAPWWSPAGVEQTEPQPPGPGELSLEVRAIEEILVSHFDGHNLTMPPMPRAAERVLKRLRDPKCGMGQVAADLAEDQVTAANVLRMANSPLYRGIKKIENLQNAVTRLGGNAIRTLMMHESLRAAVFQRKGGNLRLTQVVWRGSLAGASVMHDLAELTGRVTEDAFLIGLLHDIGNVIVLRLVQEQKVVSPDLIDTATFEYLCHECHQEFGELVADAWQLPPKLKSLISDHHVHPAADDPLRTEKLMVILADMINQMIGYGPPAQYDLVRTRAVHELGLIGRVGLEAKLAGLPEAVAAATASYE